jgi:hypothetical protein
MTKLIFGEEYCVRFGRGGHQDFLHGVGSRKFVYIGLYTFKPFKTTVVRKLPNPDTAVIFEEVTKILCVGDRRRIS